MNKTLPVAIGASADAKNTLPLSQLDQYLTAKMVIELNKGAYRDGEDSLTQIQELLGVIKPQRI